LGRAIYRVFLGREAGNARAHHNDLCHHWGPGGAERPSAATQPRVTRRRLTAWFDRRVANACHACVRIGALGPIRRHRSFSGLRLIALAGIAVTVLLLVSDISR
jgi:hypothetical protein